MGDGHSTTLVGSGTVDRVSHNGAGQDGGWRQRGAQASAALAETWDSLAGVCHELSTTEWGLATECPGWDVKDQLSHLIGIERALLGEPAPAWGGPVGPHVKNDVGAMNERWVAVRRPLPGAAVRAEFVEVTRTRLAQLAARSEEDWAAVGFSPVGEVPYAVFMEVRTFDSWVHEQDVRRALDRPGGGGNRASALSLDHVQGAMPFVVGKQAKCADGTAVRFEVSGPGHDTRLHHRRRGWAGTRGRRRGGAQRGAVAVERRLRAPGLWAGHGDTGGGCRRSPLAGGTRPRDAVSSVQ